MNISWVLIGLSLAASGGTAWGWQTTPLSDNDIDDWAPKVSEAGVVWWCESGEIWYYDWTSPSPVAGMYYVGFPDLDGSLAAWSGQTSGEYEVYTFDAEAGLVSQITNSGTYKTDVCVSGDNVAWTEGGTIQHYVGGTLTAVPSQGTSPGWLTVNDTHLAWVASDGGEHVYLHDLANNTTTDVTGNDAWAYMPAISDTHLVWKASQGLKLRELVTGDTIVVPDSLGATFPKLHGTHVVWEGNDGDDYEVYLYDIATGITQALSDNDFDDVTPTVSDQYVAWESTEGLFVYDLSSGLTDRITDMNAHDAEIQADTIVWHGQVPGDTDFEIYMATPTPEPGMVCLILIGAAFLRGRVTR